MLAVAANIIHQDTHMLQISFDPFPEINTERLRLRRLHAGDVAQIFFLRSDDDMMQYLDKPKLQTPAEAATLIDRLLRLEEANEGINWAITLKGDNTLWGTICLFHIEPEHYRGELGYMLHTRQQGKGLMQEAVGAVLAYGFQQLKLHSILANINPGNEASVKTLKRHNFVQEGYFRENYFYDGKFLDTAVYGLLNPYAV